MRISDWSSDCGSSDLVFEVGETHLAGVAAEHFGGQQVELDAVAARGGADDRGDQRLVEADARAAGRGDGEGFGPDMADRLDHQAIAARREDIAPAPFEFGHRVALAAAAEDAIAERQDGLRGFDRQIAHQRLFGYSADQLAAFPAVRFYRPLPADRNRLVYGT